jgi:hypothetical protein
VTTAHLAKVASALSTVSSPTGNDVPPAVKQGPRYAAETAQVRAVVKWTIVALAAVATAMLGLKPIVSPPRIDWSDTSDLVRVAVALLVGVASAFAVVLLIMTIAQILAPQSHNLAQLPKKLKKDIETNPEFFLPVECPDLATFQQELPKKRQAVAQAATDVDGAEDDYRAAKTPWGRQAAQLARELQAQNLEVAVHNRDVYLAAAERILDQAAFEATADAFVRNRGRIIALAVTAVAATFVFQIALADEPADPTPSTNVQAQPAYLPRPQNPTQQQLWDALGLGPCALNDGSAPVIITAGKGTRDDPWQVSTLGLGGAVCPAMTFPLVAEATPLRIPHPITAKVTYSTG